jgi:hypothetical protein
MIEKLEQVKKQLEQFEMTIQNQNFFGIEEVDINKIKEIKDPAEVEKIIELFLDIRNLSTYSAGPLGYIRCKAVELRIEVERHLALIKQKALQQEELIFYLSYFLFSRAGLYNFFHDFGVFLA